jgi:hypothetical protein
MLPPWMIEKLEQERREREAQDRPRLEIEIQPPDAPHQPERPDPRASSVITIQVW